MFGPGILGVLLIFLGLDFLLPFNHSCYLKSRVLGHKLARYRLIMGAQKSAWDNVVMG